jgi:plasmid stability protein
MPDIILRNLDASLKQALRERAARHGRSMAAELREIVRAAVAGPDADPNVDFKKLAAALRTSTPRRKQTPAGVLQREGRDER